jgi:hypothetical protein
MHEAGLPLPTSAGTPVIGVPQANPRSPGGDDGGPDDRAIANIPWSSPDVRRAAETLRRGYTQVVVSTRAQAEELFRRLFQGRGYRNTTGLSGREVRDLFGEKAGTYHWDPADAEWGAPHLQIHTFEGTVIRIFFSD